MDIDKMEASRELDAMVAEKVMGWKWFTFIHTSYLLPADAVERKIIAGVDSWGSWETGKHGEPDLEWAHMPSMDFWTVSHYSTTITAAWMVVEKMRDKGFDCDLVWNASGKPHVRFEGHPGHFGEDSRPDSGFVYGDTAPLAICRAALKAVAG